ncbi:MAG: LysR family transcriptional regulator [Acidipropionibacterium sp.]|jgi:DNA-binding transcriptional LysR family regulator|nr:LysR family transcriptional regulator [Acidipropionibacterium sp.]
MGRVSLDGLAVFVAIARAGSVTGAADEIGSTQSTVSSQLAGLERELGYRLFERTPRGVLLTARGRDLLARVEPALDTAIAALPGAGAAVQRRVIFFGGPAEFLSAVALPGLAVQEADASTPAQPEAQAPELRVEFGEAEDLLDRLGEGALDLVVSTVQPRRRGISFQPLYDEEFVLVMSPAMAVRFRDDPDAVPVLSYSEELPIIRRYWRSVFDRPPTRLRTAAIVPDLRVLATLAERGIGMTVLPRYLAESGLAAGRLIDPVAPEISPLNTIYLARRGQRRGAAPDLDRFVTRLRRAVAAGPGVTARSAS